MSVYELHCIWNSLHMLSIIRPNEIQCLSWRTDMAKNILHTNHPRIKFGSRILSTFIPRGHHKSLLGAKIAGS